MEKSPIENKFYPVLGENIFPFKDDLPSLHESVFLAPGARIIGRVNIGEGSSIWYNTVIRGDVNFVKIGRNTNIQDCSMLHVTPELFPLIIGDNVTVGHNVTLHGCTVNNNSLIGMGAILLDGSVIEENAIVAAGSVVKEGFVVPKGKLVAGVPAKIIRDVTENEIIGIKESAIHYSENAVESKNSLNKNT